MSDLGKAYVQIMPSADGIKGMLEKGLGGAAEESGKKSGSIFLSTFKRIFVAAGVGKIFKDAIMGGGELEQSLGGIETLFKGSSDKMKAFANEAYMTAGLSANAYMENVTSFSASLLQGLGGDTDKAADIANMAMIDMSDNANKMGTDMQSIQFAYQGFAKQNYTMLDNLKLGYGGTKTEMERLLKDAQALSGVEYNIDNLSDVYSAIHVIQQEIGITGTTAQEAAETLQGSFATMQASFQNLMSKMALGMDIGPSLEAMGKSILTFVKNLFPMIKNLVVQLPTSLISVLAQATPGLITAGTDMVLNIVLGLVESIPTLVDGAMQLVIGLADGIMQAVPMIIEKVPLIINGIVDNLLGAIPKIIETGIKLLTSLINNLPKIIATIVEALPKIIDSVIKGILENIPLIIDAGVKLLTALVENLPLIILTIVEALPKIIMSVVNALVNNIPLIVETGVKLLTALITNLPQIIWTIIKSMPQIIISMISALGQGIVEFVKMGGQLISGLWRGIADKATWLWNQIKGFFSAVVSKIKNFFGISSPSKLFAEFGSDLDAGLAKGISDNTRPITQAMDEVGRLTARSFESEIAFNATSSAMSGLSVPIESNSKIDSLSGYSLEDLKQAFVAGVERLIAPLSNQQLVLDTGVLVGELVIGMDERLGQLNDYRKRGM